MTLLRSTLALPALALALLAALVLAAAVGGADAAPRAKRADRPNVVVLMTDDQTLADLDAMPSARRLIGDAGVTFARSYVSYPLCCPSRATFLTGQYAHNHGVQTNSAPLGGVAALDDDHTLPVWLDRAGYRTAHIGKYLNGYGYHMAPDAPPGWTDWHATIDKSTYQMYGYTMSENGELRTYGSYGEEDPAMYQTDVFGRKAVQAIRRHANRATPFFLSVSFVAPHGENVAPERGNNTPVRPARRHKGRFSSLELPQGPAYDEADVSDKPLVVTRLPRVGTAGKARILSDFRARREALLAVDEAIAAIVAELRRTGELDNTYVVMTSDNGYFQGEHRIIRGKYLPYDAAARVPLLIRGPGIAPGTVSEELVGNVDLAPTVLDIARARADVAVDGRSLLPFARDPARRTQRAILHEGIVAGDIDRDGIPGVRIHKAETYRAIRTARHLYVRWANAAEELYDLTADPHELQSLHGDPAQAPLKVLLGAELDRLTHCAGEACREDAATAAMRAADRRPATFGGRPSRRR
jgi:arylsulfatase A-like enzyme